jgi:hypothetical protein
LIQAARHCFVFYSSSLKVTTFFGILFRMVLEHQVASKQTLEPTARVKRLLLKHCSNHESRALTDKVKENESESQLTRQLDGSQITSVVAAWRRRCVKLWRRCVKLNRPLRTGLVAGADFLIATHRSCAGRALWSAPARAPCHNFINNTWLDA